jgi:exonuclease RecJ-like protein
LLLPACELHDLGAVGEGRHLRFRVREREQDAGSAIAFGIGGQLDRFRQAGRYDVLFRLEENHWNGTVAPQLVVRRIFDAPDRYDELRGWLAGQWRLEEAKRAPEASTVFAELELNGAAGTRRQLLESETFRSLLDEPLERAA